VEGAQQSMEMQMTFASLLSYARDFESVFAKDNFDILLEHCYWNHVIELIPGSEPKSTKVYPLSPVE